MIPEMREMKKAIDNFAKKADEFAEKYKGGATIKRVKHVRVKQVWETEVDPAKTMQEVQTTMMQVRQTGDECILQHRGGKLYMVRVAQ